MPAHGVWRAEKRGSSLDYGLRLSLRDGAKPALSLSNGRYFPEETMTFAVFKILFLSLYPFWKTVTT